MTAHDLRSRRRGVRVGAVAGPLVIGVMLLGACGGSSDDGAAESTIALSQESTAFVVRPPVTTVAAPADTVLEDGAVSTAAQDYTVVSGDNPTKIAKQFGVTIDELVAFNEWGSVGEFPYPGEVIKIPPGATAAGATTTAAPTAEAAATTAPTATIPDAGDNCGEGEYTIVAGDYEGKVAAAFDVTVDALRAANGSTNGYGAFYPGLVIIIPGKAEC